MYRDIYIYYYILFNITDFSCYLSDIEINKLHNFIIIYYSTL